MLKKFLSLILAGMLALSVTACSGSNSESASEAEESTGSQTDESKGESSNVAEAGKTVKDNSKVRVGVILKTLSSEYWKVCAAGAKQAAKDQGCQLKLQGPPSEISYNEQSSEIETMLSANQIDALCIAPLQPDMVVTKLKDATIPILFVDTDAQYDKKVTFIGTSNEEAGKTGGEYMGKKLGKGKKAVLIGGVQGDPTCEARMKGYKEGLTKYGVEVLDTQYANATTDKALQVMENYLQHFPQIDAVLCNNDDMAIGAVRACAQAGKTDIKVMGFDGTTAGAQSIIDGEMAASISQDAYQIGYQGVVNAVKAVNGENVDKRIVIETPLITSENAKQYLSDREAKMG